MSDEQVTQMGTGAVIATLSKDVFSDTKPTTSEELAQLDWEINYMLGRENPKDFSTDSAAQGVYLSLWPGVPKNKGFRVQAYRRIAALLETLEPQIHTIIREELQSRRDELVNLIKDQAKAALDKAATPSPLKAKPKKNTRRK